MSKKVVLTIAGLDPSGGAGIVADIKTFSAFDCFATSAITSVTFQNTQGVFGAVHQSAESVRNQVEPVIEDFEVSALKTGMLPTREIIEEVSDIITENTLKNIVVDPVVRSTSGFDLIDDEALRSLIDRLFPLADLVTPNLPEAQRISKLKIDSKGKVIDAAKVMRSFGAKNVLIKGGHWFDNNSADEKTKKARDFLFVGEDLVELVSDFIETSATHGTGCALAAAIAANLAQGNNLETSVRNSKTFVTEAIRNTPNLGKGNSPIGVN